MSTDQLLDMLEPIVRQYLQGDKIDGTLLVVRVPEGLLVLLRNNRGRHLLLQAHNAELVVS